MKRIPCENWVDAYTIAKSITGVIGPKLPCQEHPQGELLTPDELRNIIRQANTIAKWGREELSRILLGRTAH